MAASVRSRWTRRVAAFLAIAALVPALHDAWSHRARTSSDAVSLHATSGDVGHGIPPEICPICLATDRVSAVQEQPSPARTPVLAAAPAPPATPIVATRADVAASPRAPPSA